MAGYRHREMNPFAQKAARRFEPDLEIEAQPWRLLLTTNAGSVNDDEGGAARPNTGGAARPTKGARRGR